MGSEYLRNNNLCLQNIFLNEIKHLLLSSQAMKQRDEDLAREIEGLKNKISEIEQLARGKGLGSIFNLRHTHEIKDKQEKS